MFTIQKIINTRSPQLGTQHTVLRSYLLYLLLFLCCQLTKYLFVPSFFCSCTITMSATPKSHHVKHDVHLWPCWWLQSLEFLRRTHNTWPSTHANTVDTSEPSSEFVMMLRMAIEFVRSNWCHRVLIDLRSFGVKLRIDRWSWYILIST